MRLRHFLATAGVAALVLASPADGQSSSGSSSNTRRRADDALLTTNRYLGTRLPETDPRVSPYSSYGARNKYTTDGGRIYASDGTYLGKLNANKYDAESVANPYGQYGSKYSSTSINNPYSTYGSRYSSQSATNPYTSTPPRVTYPDPYASSTRRSSTTTPSTYRPYVYTPYGTKP